jgi:hypothetical protein
VFARMRIQEPDVRCWRQAEVAIGHRFWRVFRNPFGWLPSRQKHSDVLPSSSRRGPQVAARSEFFMISADIRIETLRHRRYLRVAHPIEEIEWTVEALASGALLWRRPSRQEVSQPSGVQGLGRESWRASSPRRRPAFWTLDKPKSGGGP